MGVLLYIYCIFLEHLFLRTPLDGCFCILEGRTLKCFLATDGEFLGSICFDSCTSLRKPCPYSELFWSKCGEMRTRITPNTNTFYSVLSEHKCLTQFTNI